MGILDLIGTVFLFRLGILLSKRPFYCQKTWFNTLFTSSTTLMTPFFTSIHVVDHVYDVI